MLAEPYILYEELKTSCFVYVEHELYVIIDISSLIEIDNISYREITIPAYTWFNTYRESIEILNFGAGNMNKIFHYSNKEYSEIN